MIFIYVRCSTADQTVAHQIEQVRAMAGVDAEIDDENIITDEGVSGVSTLFRDRPGGRRLWDKLRRGDTLWIRWVNRIGRNYEDVTDTIRNLMRRGVVIRTVINNMTFDGATTDPIQMAVRDALIGFMAASAQADAEATKIAQTAGIAHARAHKRVYLGRKPTYTQEQLDRVIAMLETETSDTAIAKETGLDRLTVRRIRQDPLKAETALAAWEELKNRPKRQRAAA